MNNNPGRLGRVLKLASIMDVLATQPTHHVPGTVEYDAHMAVVRRMGQELNGRPIFDFGPDR